MPASRRSSRRTSARSSTSRSRRAPARQHRCRRRGARDRALARLRRHARASSTAASTCSYVQARLRGDRRDSAHGTRVRRWSSCAARCCPARCATSSSPRSRSTPARRAGVDFGVCINPEFLREGTAVYDYRHPPKTVIGETRHRSSGELLAKLYAKTPGAAGPHRHRDGRDGQVRRQRLARAEGRVRQRGRQRSARRSASTATG